MPKTKRYISILLFLCIAVSVCNPDQIIPDDENNLSTNIIVKEKSISESFYSVVANLSYFISLIVFFFDSIYDNLDGGGVYINTSHFAQNRFIYFGNNSDLRDVDGDSVTTAFLFEYDNE